MDGKGSGQPSSRERRAPIQAYAAFIKTEKVSHPLIYLLRQVLTGNGAVLYSSAQ